MHLAILALGLGFGSIAHAAEDAPTTRARPARPNLSVNVPEYSLQTQMFTFPSGLRVLMQHDDSAPIMAITAVTDHGASSDPIGKEGIAHLVEHLWFRSEHGDLPKTWDLLQSDMGCDLNAFTQYDITAYMSVCPSDKTDAMFGLESLRMTDTIVGVTEEMVTTEIEVVRNEVRMRAENYNMPFFTIWEYINKNLYGDDHPYHRPMAGDHETLRSIHLTDIQSFTDAYYRPENTTIMAVGDFGERTPEEMLSLIFANFSPELLYPGATEDMLRRYPRQGVTDPDPDDPTDWTWWMADPQKPNEMINVVSEIPPHRLPQTAEALPPAHKELGVFEAPVEKPTVAVAWSLPPAYHGDDTMQQMSAVVLNLVTSIYLREPDIKEFGGCTVIEGKVNSTFICMAEVKDEDVDAARLADRIIDQVPLLYTLRDDAGNFMLDTYLYNARNSMYADTLRSLDLYAAVGAGRATDIAQYAHFAGEPAFHSAKMNEASKVTSSEIATFAQNYLTRDRAARIFIKPMERDDLLVTSGDTSGGYHGNPGGAQIANPAVSSQQITPELVMDTFQAPDLSLMQERRLSNGLRVVVMHHSEAPVVNVRLISRGGWATDPTTLYQYGRVFSDATRDPTAALQIAGAWYGDYEDTNEYAGMEASSGNLDGALWLLRESVESMRPDLGGKATWIRKRRKSIIDDLGEMSWHIRDMSREHRNPNHPLNQRITYESLDQWDEWGATEARTSLQQKWHPENSVLLIVGRIDAQEALDLADTYMGSWRQPDGIGPASSEMPPGPGESKPTAYYVFDDEGKTQTQVVMSCNLAPASGRRSAVHDVMSSILGQRLMQRLREEAGVVYSPSAYHTVQPGGTTTLVMVANVQNDAVAFAAQVYDELVQEVARGEMDEDRIRQVKLTLARNFGLGHQSVRQMIDRLSATVGNGEGWDSYEQYASELAAVDAAAVAGAIGQCTDRAFYSFQGPSEIIDPLLDEANISYEVVDWEERGREIHKRLDPKGFAQAEKKRKKKKKGDEEEEAEEE